MTDSQLILASGSPRRRQLLEMLNVSFHVLVTDADEQLNPAWTPATAVEQLALRKAQAAIERTAMAWTEPYVIVAADTVVAIDAIILGKPRDEDDALTMLNRLQGQTHDVFTGISVHNTATEQSVTTHVRTRVTMRPREPEWLKWYIATGDPMDKAGSYGIQGLGSLLVERIDGDYYNVVGLPLQRLERAFDEAGAPLRQFMNVAPQL